MGNVYMCIDLKSFYASVECVARGYDPFKVPLVVADPTRGDGARIVMKEMVENLVLELVENDLYAKGISLFIGYSKNCIPATGGRVKLSQTTCSIKKIQAAFEKLFIEKIKIGYGIRQIGISLTDLTYEPDMQLSFFDYPEDDEKEKNIEVAMIDIRNRFGKNSLLKGFNFLDKATGIKRNMMVGGHNG